MHPFRAVLVAAAVALIGAGIAFATIPDSSGKIHACHKLSGGALRVIDSGPCLLSEAPQTGKREPRQNRNHGRELRLRPRRLGR